MFYFLQISHIVILYFLSNNPIYEYVDPDVFVVFVDSHILFNCFLEFYIFFKCTVMFGSIYFMNPKTLKSECFLPK